MRGGYRTATVGGRRWVWHGDEIVGAVSYNGVRAYVFPLMTPGGVPVLQECAPDHVHHQGIMVGQDLVNGENFWAMLHPAHPLNRQALIAEECRCGTDGVTFELVLDWTTAARVPVARERRLIRLARHDGCTEAFVRSTQAAAFGPLSFGVTKEGGIGMRVHPLLETALGGRILDSEGRTGERAVFDQRAAWIDVSGVVAGRPVGILIAPDPAEPRIPWFVRDYGLHLHSPRRHTPLALERGETVTSAVRFLAHDGLGERAALDALLAGRGANA